MPALNGSLAAFPTGFCRNILISFSVRPIRILFLRGKEEGRGHTRKTVRDGGL